MKKIMCAVILFLICSWPTVSAQDIFINEFSVDSSPQGVELINTGGNIFDISDWYIDDSSGTTYFSIPHNTIIYPNSCIVFASEFNLNKSTPDTVRLFDSSAPPTSPSAKLIDAYAYNVGPGTNMSYARIPDGLSSWQIVNVSLGQFNTSLQNCIIQPTQTPSPVPTNTIVPTSTPTSTPSVTPTLRPTNSPSPTPTPAQPTINNVYISEAMVHPETGQKEWVELYNNNNFNVSLVNWYIDDRENEGAAPKQFSLDIPAKGYAVYELSLGIFNNDGDEVRLLNALKEEVDSSEFRLSESGQTVGRNNFETNDLCPQEPSKGSPNNSCIAPTDVPLITSSVSTTSSVAPKVPTPIKVILSSPTSDLSNNQSVSDSLSTTINYKNSSSIATLLPLSSTPSSFNKTEDANVLGITDQKEIGNISLLPFITSFSFSSASLSILGMLSCILKLRSKIGTKNNTETVLSKLNFFI